MDKRHARAAKFVRAIARKLCSEKYDTKVISRLDALLEHAVEDLPMGPIRETLESDPRKYAELLRQIMVDIRPELKKEPEQKHDDSLESLLKTSQESLVTDVEFARAVEAIVRGVENGAGSSGNLDEWIASCRRALGSRSNPPLALWWAYAGLELQQVPAVSGDEAERTLHVVAWAVKLMERLKSLTSGRYHSFTAAAALAPVLAGLFEAGCILASASDCQSESWRKAVKTLNLACKQVLGCISTYRSRKVVECESVFTANGIVALSLDFRGLALAAKGINGVTKQEIVRKGVAKLFPLASEGQKQKLTLEVRDMETCAGVVCGEAFLMRLMVTILRQRSKSNSSAILENPDLCDELRLLVVQGTDLIVDLMMDPKLPVKPFLNENEETLLKGVLFDVVSRSSLKANDRPDVFMKKLVLARRAIEFYRSNGGRSKAVELRSQLSSWKIPKGLPQWLLSLKVEEQLPNNILKDSRALSGWLTDPANEKAVVSILSHITSVNFISHVEEDSFCVDTRPDMEAIERLDQAFMSAAEEMKTTESEKQKPHSSDSEDEKDASDDDAEQDEEASADPAQAVNNVIVGNLRNAVAAVLVEVPALAAPLDSIQTEVNDPVVEATEQVETGRAAGQDDPEAAPSATPSAEPAAKKANSDKPDAKDNTEGKNTETADTASVVETKSETSDAKGIKATSVPFAERTTIDMNMEIEGEKNATQLTSRSLASAKTLTRKPDVEDMEVKQPPLGSFTEADTTGRQDNGEIAKDESIVIDLVIESRAVAPAVTSAVAEDMECPSTPSVANQEGKIPERAEEETLTAKQSKTKERRKSKVLETPLGNTKDVITPSSVRCTRSGRKYGAIDTPAITTVKKRRYI